MKSLSCWLKIMAKDKDFSQTDTTKDKHTQSKLDALNYYCPPRWPKGNGLDCGLDDPGRFPAYPHRLRALWWQGGERHPRTSRRPCRGRLGTLKTPSCQCRWVPGSRLKFGNWTTVPSLYSCNIAECEVNHNQPTNWITNWIPIRRCKTQTWKFAFNGANNNVYYNFITLDDFIN